MRSRVADSRPLIGGFLLSDRHPANERAAFILAYTEKLAKHNYSMMSKGFIT
jgi:hypothetical protein